MSEIMATLRAAARAALLLARCILARSWQPLTDEVDRLEASLADLRQQAMTPNLDDLRHVRAVIQREIDGKPPA